MADRSSRPGITVPSAILLTAFALAVGPGLVAAHGVTSTRFDAPLPLWLLLSGAGATVAATAALVALGDRRTGSATVASVEQEGAGRARATIPARIARYCRWVLGGGFLLLAGAVLLAGVGGRQSAATNLATVATWPLWFHGLAIIAILVGNPWPVLSPWRTVYQGLVRLEGKPVSVLSDGAPSWLSAWPALVGFVVLYGAVENLTVIPRSPRLTAVLVAVVAVAMILGAVLVGPAWLRRADPFGVLFGLLGRVSPIAFSTAGTDSALAITLQPPWRGCERPVGNASLAVFVVAMVYTVSFDGARELQAFQSVLFAVRDFLGTGPGTSVLLYGAGLGCFLVLFALTSWLVERLGAGEGGRWRTAALAVAPTLLPIAAAYEIAHVYEYVLRNLGQLPSVLAAVVGLDVAPIAPLAWLSLPTFWASQVLLVVLGHIVAVIAAHHVASRRFDGARAATLAHLPLVGLMVGYTALSLWILSVPVVA